MSLWYRDTFFGSIVYNRSIVYVQQIFLKVAVLLFINDLLNQTTRLYKIQVTVIYSRANLVAVVALPLYDSVAW